MATSTAPAKISFDEYLAREAGAKFKSEYRSGEVFAMAGGTPSHSELQGSIISLLRLNKPSGCRVFTSDLKIFAPAVNEGMYPDASLVCGELEFYRGRNDVILNPMLVVEVLSPSTRDYDLGMKASFYRTIASLATLLFVDSERRWIQRQSRQPDASGHWILTEFSDPGQTVWIDGNRQIGVADIYDGIL